jgi:putative ABC transport system permease protein
VIGWGIKDSISDIVRIQFSEIFHYDNQIYLENSHHIDENIEILKDNFDNEEAVAFMTYTTKVYLNNDDDTANMIVMDPRDAYVILDLRETDKETPIRLNSEGVIVSEKFARNNRIKKGDFITLESINGLKAEVRVANICEMYFQHYIFMSSSVYEHLFEEEPDFTVIAVKTSDPETLRRDAEDLEGFVSIVDFSGMISSFDTMIKALDLIIAVIIVTAGSLAFVVLMNITQVNISERIREIATFKVLGFNNREIDLYIFKEILLLTLIGSLLGLPLGVLEHHFIMNVINMEMIMFGMNISLRSFAYAFAITFVFTGIVLLYMRRPLKKVDMVESLKSVE